MYYAHTHSLLIYFPDHNLIQETITFYFDGHTFQSSFLPHHIAAVASYFAN